MFWVMRTFYDIEITPKAEYFYKYLTKIVKEEWTQDDFNQYYEDIIVELAKEQGVTRIEAATIFYMYFKTLKQKIAEWNGAK